ncbi:MAG: metal ABC transporter permease [Gemmatimonadota bacterium]|nr:metal ABC transporter permease [Gemmatimonadota bacterium]MDH3422594.1 metal ABC transporter permease [Gemmatimonadota bacterium]
MIDLMIPPIVAALLILSIHAYLGLHVIARQIIFVDLAFAQIAALGATVALLAGFEHGTTPSLVFSLAFTLIGALVFSLTRMEESSVPQEAIIGITFVVAGAAVIMLAGFTAEGTQHLQETMTGTLIWVDWSTIGRMAAVYAVVGIFHFVLRRPFLTVSFAPEKAERVRLWDFLFYASFGLVISFSVEVAGVLMVFSALVIPAVIAFLFTNRLSLALVLAWLAGALAIVGGIGASFYWDVATGPLLVCTFGGVLVLAALLRAVLGIRPEGEIIVDALAGTNESR